MVPTERNMHVKYQSPSTYHLKDIGKVKVSDRMTMTPPPPCHSKVMTNVKVLESRSKFKVRRSRILVPTERSCLEEHTCEISKP